MCSGCVMIRICMFPGPTDHLVLNSELVRFPGEDCFSHSQRPQLPVVPCSIDASWAFPIHFGISLVCPCSAPV